MDHAHSEVLVAVESASIQSFIFKSNRLQENVGASHLVSQATDDWVNEARQQVIHNQKAHPGDIEIIYAGGGKSVIWFRTSELAKAFTRHLTARVLLDAPGLQLTVAHQDVKPTIGLSQQVKQLLRALNPARSAIPRNSSLAGLSVTAACQSTGLPAVALHEYKRADGNAERRYVSAEVNAKLNAFPAADKKLEHTLALGEAYTYPWDLDLLGREEGESSYIAVVHADGNGMGHLIGRIGKAFKNPKDDDRYMNAMRTFSNDIKVMTETALQRVLDGLTNAVRYDPKIDEDVIQATEWQPRIILKRHPQNRSQIVLPFRPLVTGGDDVTFICDGRIGLSLAIAFLRFFERESRAVMTTLKENLAGTDVAADLPDYLTACAGAVIVKSHYPFARAYDLAEQLCDEAKKFKRQNRLQGSVLDWHFTPGGLYGTLDDIRNREYKLVIQETETTPETVWNYSLRPVSLDGECPIQSWPLIEGVLSEFQHKWTSKRNKAKALYDALRVGPASVSLFANRYEQNLPVIKGFVDGWYPSEKDAVQADPPNEQPVNYYCGYTDALELMDLYIPLMMETVK